MRPKNSVTIRSASSPDRLSDPEHHAHRGRLRAVSRRRRAPANDPVRDGGLRDVRPGCALGERLLKLDDAANDVPPATRGEAGSMVRQLRASLTTVSYTHTLSAGPHLPTSRRSNIPEHVSERGDVGYCATVVLKRRLCIAVRRRILVGFEYRRAACSTNPSTSRPARRFSTLAARTMPGSGASLLTAGTSG
jgi:hypothetical protein